MEDVKATRQQWQDWIIRQSEIGFPNPEAEMLAQEILLDLRTLELNPWDQQKAGAFRILRGWLSEHTDQFEAAMRRHQ